VSIRPYITYPKATGWVETHKIGIVIAKCYINEAGQDSNYQAYNNTWPILMIYPMCLNIT